LVEIKDRDKNYKRQKSVQLAVYLFEVFGFIFTVLTVCSLIDTGHIFGWLKGISAYDFLDKIITIFTLHTLAVFAYLRLKISASDDANLSINTLISHALNMSKFGVPLDEILIQCEQLTTTMNGRTNMLNMGDVKRINFVKEQTELLIGNAISELEYEYRLETLRIKLNHNTQANNLAWTNSFFLNLFK
jgi:hypothetical protein